MADKFKPNIIKDLESKNKLTIIANHYGSTDMRFEFIKIPKIQFCELSENEIENAVNTLKHKYSFLHYEYSSPKKGIAALKLIFIQPKFFDKQIGPVTKKYVTLTHFNMIGTINVEHLKEIEQLVST